MSKKKNKKVAGIRSTFKKVKCQEKELKKVVSKRKLAEREILPTGLTVGETLESIKDFNNKDAASVLRNKSDCNTTLCDATIVDNGNRRWRKHDIKEWHEGQPSELIDKKVGGTVKIDTNIENGLRKVVNSLKESVLLLSRVIDDVMNQIGNK